MDFEQAKQQLIDNAVGSNEYENINTWSELHDAAEQEQFYARDRVRLLGELLSLASDKI
jgi:hypothetical protein